MLRITYTCVASYLCVAAFLSDAAYYVHVCSSVLVCSCVVVCVAYMWDLTMTICLLQTIVACCITAIIWCQAKNLIIIPHAEHFSYFSVQQKD